MDLDPKLWWYVTRASGFVAWTLLAVAVVWGLFITNKTLTRTTPPAWVLDLHRHLGGLAVVFVAIHVGVLPLDTYTDWGWRDLFVPMATSWHPGAVAWGIVGMYLLVAIEVTSLLGRRLARKWWRRVHMLSFPLYVIASIHLFQAGTDSGNAVAQGVVIVTSTLVVFLTAVRGLAAAKPREPRANPRIAAACTTTTPTRTAFGASDAPSTRQPPNVDVGAPPKSPGRRSPMTVDERAAKIHSRTAGAAQRSRERVPDGPRDRTPIGARASDAG